MDDVDKSDNNPAPSKEQQPPKQRAHDGRGMLVGSRLGLYVGEKIEAHHLGFDTATMQLGKIYISNFRLLFVPDDPHKVL